ncbi:MAG: RNA recognition motif domain-containing protein [Ignavibacteriaceae bacterium]
MKLYIGNLSKQVTEADLNEVFSPYGNIASTSIIKDRDTQESKGFGFIEFNDNTEGAKAMKELNSKEIKGREIVVNEARPKTDRPSGGFSSNRRY